MIVLLSACQSVEKNTKLIAGTFNTATNIQMKMLDRFAPPDVIVHNNIPYQASPELNVDIYQPKNIDRLLKQLIFRWCFKKYAEKKQVEF